MCRPDEEFKAKVRTLHQRQIWKEFANFNDMTNMPLVFVFPLEVGTTGKAWQVMPLMLEHDYVHIDGIIPLSPIETENRSSGSDNLSRVRKDRIFGR